MSWYNSLSATGLGGGLMLAEMYDVTRATMPCLTAMEQFTGHRVTSSVQHSKLALKIARLWTAALLEEGDVGASAIDSLEIIGVNCTT